MYQVDHRKKNLLEHHSMVNIDKYEGNYLLILFFSYLYSIKFLNPLYLIFNSTYGNAV
jgi:hypothetical protein